jgi:hypothetical protein
MSKIIGPSVMFVDKFMEISGEVHLEEYSYNQ